MSEVINIPLNVRELTLLMRALKEKANRSECEDFITELTELKEKLDNYSLELEEIL